MKRYALMCVLALVVVFGATAAAQAMEPAPRLDKGTTEHHWGRGSHRGGRGWRNARGGWRRGGGYYHHGYYGYYN